MRRVLVRRVNGSVTPSITGSIRPHVAGFCFVGQVEVRLLCGVSRGAFEKVFMPWEQVEKVCLKGCVGRD